MRINRAEDDAAGFAIGTKIGARIAGLNQALQNVSDAKSVLDVAESGTNQLLDLLNKIKKDVTQGANAVPGTLERDFIRQSINGYAGEINQIVEQTEFNGTPLLDGTYNATFQVGEAAGEHLNISLDDNLKAQELQVFEVSTGGQLSTDGTATENSTINVFEQWQNIQAGDTFDINITRSDGSQVDPITITAAGDKGELTSTTIADVVSAVNAQGEFEAEFNEDDQAIKIREISPDEGNNLTVSIDNYEQFPGTDGAEAEVNFEFEEETGAMVTNFTGTDPIDAGTLLNDLDQFEILEGQDEITVTLTARDGETSEIVKVIDGDSATPASTTVGELFDAIDNQAGDKFDVELRTDGQIAVTENDLEQFALETTTEFEEFDLRIDPTSVDDVTFESQVSEVAYSDSSGVITETTTLAGSDLGDDFREGDSFRIQLTASDGSTENFRYEFDGRDDTFGDLRDAINTETGFEATIDNGELRMRESELRGSGSVNAEFNDFQNTDVDFQDPGADQQYLEYALSDAAHGAINDNTELRDSFLGEEFRQGDQFDITVVRDDGTTAKEVTYTFEHSDDTIEDLTNFINNDTDLDAEVIDGMLAIGDPDEPDGSYEVQLHNFQANDVFADPDFQEDNDKLVLPNDGEPMDEQTELDGSVLGEGFRDGDSFELALTTSDGNTTEVLNFTYSDGMTFGDIKDSINNDPSDFQAEIANDQLEITDTSGTTGDNFDAEFQNYNQGTNSEFNTSTLQPAADELVITNNTDPLQESTELDGSVFGDNFMEGDTFTVTLTDNDGSTADFIYEFENGDTFGDLAGAIEDETDFTTSIENDQLIITPPEARAGEQLAISFTDFDSVDAQFTNTQLDVSARQSVSINQLTGIEDEDTLLVDLEEFENVQGEDELTVHVEDGAGNPDSFTFEFDGELHELSTSTVGDFIQAINTQTTLEAEFDPDGEAVTLNDPALPDEAPQLYFTEDDLETADRESTAATNDPPLTFGYDDNTEGMVSNQLTSGGTAAGPATRINDLDSFDEIQGQDELTFELTTRAGDRREVTFEFDDVDPGEESDKTVQDLLDYLDGQEVSGVEFEAGLVDGRIELAEINPPQTGDFDSETEFEEYDISIEPSSFHEFGFSISDFLELTDETGLPLGLGFVDLDADTELSQNVSTLLLRNIDDAISRVASVVNEIGTFQSQLSNREEFLQNTINAHTATRSRIMDADFAREQSNLIQKQLLYQNQITALSQANFAPRSLLDLL